MKAVTRFDRRSLRWKLPWLFASTAALSVAAFGLLAYGSARALAIETASTRLTSALSQLRTVAELGVVNQLASLRTAAQDPSMIQALRTSAPVPDAAVRALRALKGASDSTVVVELIDRNGVLRYILPETAGAPGEPRAIVAPAQAAIGPMQQQRDAVSFEATVPVTTGPRALGWIRVVRQQKNTINRRMAGNLLEGSVLLAGNADGTLWGPSGPVAYPVATARPTQRYLRDGERWISVSQPIRGTPWLYAVELPERLALGPATALILPFVFTGILIAAAGAFVGLRVSRRITNPLGDLTTAAEALAQGERNVTLAAADRADEIGRLARAFGIMAESVTAARSRLEAEVDARTGELTSVSGRLNVLREELRESERLATLGRLSGSVGHELRNPLGVMSNVVFLIDTLPEASGKLKEYARLLREQIRISDRIISDVLDQARSGAPVRVEVDIPALFDEIVLRAEVPATIQVERQWTPEFPRLVLDRDRLAQILWNLVRNAVQAMQGQSGVVTLSAAFADGRLRIEVRDTGKGIAESDAERVFEPMFTTKTDGIGLGLSISRAFARASGGDLYLRSVDQGACFVLELPAAIREIDSSRDRASPPVSGSAASRTPSYRVSNRSDAESAR